LPVVYRGSAIHIADGNSLKKDDLVTNKNGENYLNQPIPLPAHDWYECLPKVELHLHLDGALPLPTLWALVQKYGTDPSITSLEDLCHRFIFRDFLHFIETWVWKNQFLREYEDFTFFAEATARDLAKQNIRYAEAHFAPTGYSQHGLEIPGIAQAIRTGLAKVPEIEIVLVADLVRSSSPERAARILAEVNEAREAGIIGVGIGGPEPGNPPEPLAVVYDEARRLGFHTTAHAGEAAGAESIWGTLRSLQVERIGHGTRAFEDQRLLDYLCQKQIPLEMCPLSNVCTAVVPSLEAHPIRHYYETGLLVTVNTDDPMMFNNSLAQEYRLLVECLGFTPDDVRNLILNGVRASWLPEERKAAMITAFQVDPAWRE
jgi:adenosine deaminase